MTIPYRSAVTFGRPFIDIGRDGCATVLRILKSGWERALNWPEMHPDTEEPEITECLRNGMREALKDGIVSLSKQITILPGTESRSSPKVLRPDGRTDIPVYFQWVREEYDEHDPHAIIECKRVAGNSADLCREYVVNGIDRFKDGRYARNHAAGFMAGYLLSGSADAAANRINKYLTGKGRQPEHLGASDVLREPWARTSRHPRQGRTTPVDLHHAFFGFQPVPA